MVDNTPRDNSATHCDLSICIVTTADDMHSETFRAMLSSVPRGCEVVILVNHIGAANDDAVIEHICDDDVAGIHVRMYRVQLHELDMGRLRNMCAAQATRTWCMWLDADDIIAYGDVARMIAAAPPSVGGYMIQCVGLQSIDGANVTHYSTSQIRIWRRCVTDVWIGAIHEIIDRRKIESAGYVIAYADIVIHHSGYVCSRERHVMRMARNVRGLLHTLLSVWDSDDELRVHYCRVLADNLNMYNQLREEQCRA